jgi:hypothetical protein
MVKLYFYVSLQFYKKTRDGTLLVIGMAGATGG